MSSNKKTTSATFPSGLFIVDLRGLQLEEADQRDLSKAIQATVLDKLASMPNAVGGPAGSELGGPIYGFMMR